MNIHTLSKFWNLRAELDKAVVNKDCHKITEVKAKYKDFMENETGYSQAYTCYNTGFYTDQERYDHNIKNLNSILKNIEAFERKYVLGEKASLKIKLPFGAPFLAADIWVLRAMYDKFLVQSKKLAQEDWQVQQNMILGQVVKDRLMTLMYMQPTEGFRDVITPMLNEVVDGYKQAYGRAEPKLHYLQIAEDFLER